MSEKGEIVLIVDDQEINRKLIRKQLEDTYTILEASNGLEALELVYKTPKVGVVLLDLVMPVMGGMQFIQKMKEEGMGAIPIIVMTANEDKHMESLVLSAGAIDYVAKPADRLILRSRIENALMRNQMVLLQRMEFMASHDTLTGLYNRNKMFEKTHEMLLAHPETQFAFVRVDLDKFRLYKTAMGEAEGDKRLLFITEAVKKMASVFDICAYGRIDADVFCICEPYDEERIAEHVRKSQEALSSYRPDYTLESSFGVYVIDDIELSVETIFTRASMASDKCKNFYECHMAYYDAAMSEKINQEQRVTNDMLPALEQEQFEIYLQPKYDLNTDMPCGAEALVRWNHPKKGLVSPGCFIPVFEKNGFIAKLDYYMWEHVCMLLHKWITEKKEVAPVSVNMSRISMFNRHVDELITGLTEKYEIPPTLLNLEITESAYMSNPEMMGETIARLRKAGFLILMDDFGSGYSSLNTLKEIDIDILKLDMKFMPNGSDNGKSERIISSIVRMAGWLGMDVIAEGVETAEQKQFLESIGCGYVQGYYYAKPMPVQDYEQLMIKNKPLTHMKKAGEDKRELSAAVWSGNPQINDILSSIQTPVAILECSPTGTDLIRTNQSFQTEFGAETKRGLYGHLNGEDEQRAKTVFAEAAERGKPVECEVQYISPAGKCIWLRIKLQRLAIIPKAAIICCMIEDITKEKLYEKRLRQLVSTFDDLSEKKKLLVVDDLEVSRAVIRSMFEDQYEILEAENGAAGLQLLIDHQSEIAVILLDMMMPEMDGKAFLDAKNRIKGMNDIPVVVISAESSNAVQLGMLKNGVSDYILKPFDVDIAKQRVENAMSYQSRFKELVTEYRNVTEREKNQ